MNDQLFIFESTDYQTYPLGGPLGTIKNFLRFTHCNCLLVGLTNRKNTSIGKWLRINIDGRDYEFLPLARAKREIVPHKILMLFGMIYFRRQILAKCQKKSINAMFLNNRECYSALRYILSPEKKINAFYKMTDAVNPLVTSGRSIAHVKWLQSLYFELFFKPLIKESKIIFSISDECRKFCEETLVRENERKKIVDLNHFVDFDRLVNIYKNSQAIVKSDKKRLIFWGRIVAVKGLDLMIESMQKLLSQGEDFELWIIGDGEERKKLEMLVDQFNLGNIIKFFGRKNIEEIAGLSNGASLFLMSSHNEGIPTSMLEAMTFGLPIVSTAVGGIPNLVSEGVNGYLAENRDPALYTKKIQKALQLDREKAKFYGKNLVFSSFSARSVVEQMDALIDKSC